MNDFRDNVLFGFFLASCSVAELCKNGIMYSDFHEGNIFIDESGNVKIADMDDVEFLDFPEEIESYAKAILNFHSNFDINLGAAFRFGFIHVTGEVGKTLYDILYNNNDLTCLSSKHNTVPLTLDIIKLKTVYKEWNDLIQESFIRNQTKETYKYDEYCFFDIMRQNNEGYHKFKEKYSSNSSIMRHEYQTYFANSLYSGNDFDIVSAALTLSQLEFFDENYILASYYFFVVREILLHNEENDLFKGHLEISMQIAGLFAQKFGIDSFNTIQHNIAFENFKLRSKEAWVNRYLEIWYWTDYSIEYTIDDLIREKEYKYYQCNNCHYIDFSEKLDNGCPRCKSMNLAELSDNEYIQAMADIMMKEQEDRKIHDIDLPLLDSVDIIPIHLNAINLYERNKKYKEAIKIACNIEEYLFANPKIKDEKGYVLVKSCKAGNIFRDMYNPNLIMKLFKIDTEYVKSDYEALIYFKLCKLYKELADDSAALTYAYKIIDLSNNSLRWVENRFVEYAYNFLYKYEKQRGNYSHALGYSNIIFTYNLLKNIEHDSQEYIPMINCLGEDNANSGNIALAYICYLYSLRHHIFHYGISHPGSAMIYCNIAQLYAIKKQCKNAFEYFAIAIRLIEISNNSKYANLALKVEQMLKEYLIELNYPASYEDWKEEWLTDQVFDIFPEERFVKDNNTFNMSSSEEFITFDA